MGQNFSHFCSYCNKPQIIDTLNDTNQLNCGKNGNITSKTISKRSDHTERERNMSIDFHSCVEKMKSPLESPRTRDAKIVNNIIREIMSLNKVHHEKRIKHEKDLVLKTFSIDLTGNLLGPCKINKNHILEKRYDRVTFQCDGCSRSWLVKSYCCLLCNFDLCKSCHNKHIGKGNSTNNILSTSHRFIEPSVQQIQMSTNNLLKLPSVIPNIPDLNHISALKRLSNPQIKSILKKPEETFINMTFTDRDKENEKKGIYISKL